MEDFNEKQEIKNNVCEDKQDEKQEEKQEDKQEENRALSKENYESLTQYQKEKYDRLFSQQRIEHNIDLTRRIEKLHTDDNE